MSHPSIIFLYLLLFINVKRETIVRIYCVFLSEKCLCYPNFFSNILRSKIDKNSPNRSIKLIKKCQSSTFLFISVMLLSFIDLTSSAGNLFRIYPGHICLQFKSRYATRKFNIVPTVTDKQTCHTVLL